MDMGKTNIEPLIQLTAPEPLSSACARLSAVGPAFDEHLRQVQATSQPPEPSRDDPPADECERASSPSTAEEPLRSRADDPSQSTPSESEAECGADQSSDCAESAPTEDDAGDADVPVAEEVDDANDGDDVAEAIAAVTTSQAQTVLVDEAVAQQLAGANVSEADSARIDQAASSQITQEVTQTISGKLAAGNAEALLSEPVPVVEGEEQAASPTVVADVTAETSHRAKAATAKRNAAESAQSPAVDESRLASDSPHERGAVQVRPDATTVQDDAQQHAGEQTVESRGDLLSATNKITARQPMVAGATNDEGQPNPRVAAEPIATVQNSEIVGLATAEGTAEDLERVNPADDASSGTSHRVDQASGRMDGVLSALGRFHRGSPVGHGGGSGESMEMPQVDSARFIGRVTKAFETAQHRGGTLQLRLSPPELGSVKLELTVNQGVMTASLETENAAARQTLLNHLPALRERLAEQNIRIERFDIDVRQEGGGQSSMEPRQQPPDTAPGDDAVRVTRRSTISPEVVPAVIQRIDSSGINVIA
jgi:flagellar hook-length control protein FliK